MPNKGILTPLNPEVNSMDQQHELHELDRPLEKNDFSLFQQEQISTLASHLSILGA